MTETPYQLEYYLDDNGKAPFLGWLYSLRDKMAEYRIRARLDRVELGNFGTVKPVGDGVSELKIDPGPGSHLLRHERKECCAAAHWWRQVNSAKGY